jgi:hypothetical protein
VEGIRTLLAGQEIEALLDLPEMRMVSFGVGGALAG